MGGKAIAIAFYLLFCAGVFAKGLDIYQDRALYEAGTPAYTTMSIELYAFGFIAMALGLFVIRILRARGPQPRKRKS